MPNEYANGIPLKMHKKNKNCCWKEKNAWVPGHTFVNKGMPTQTQYTAFVFIVGLLLEHTLYNKVHL